MSEPFMLEHWHEFERCIAPTAGPIQHAEMRLAWFAGVHQVLTHLAGAPDNLLLRMRTDFLLRESEAAIEDEGRRVVEREPRS
jgi:hypothetical protein